MSQTTSPLDQEPIFSEVKTLIEHGESNSYIAQFITSAHKQETSSDSIRRFRRRHQLQVPGVERASTKITGDTAKGVTKPVEGVILDDPDAMLRERGLDPEQWFIDNITVNEWEGPKTGGNKVTYHQAKFTAKRKKPEFQIVAPRSDGWRPPKRTRRSVRADGSVLYVIAGDQQAPFHDPVLHGQFLEWLRVNRPDQGVNLGDSIDLPDISRHQLDPENTATVNECLQSGYDMFRGYVEASPDTAWQKLYGNHDERIRNLILDKPKNQPLYGLKRPDTPTEKGESVLELSHLMRLDELGIDLVLPHGGYELGQINITKYLAVRHGWLARKGSGSSALATLDHLGYSVLVGHTHRQAVVHQTKHEIDGKIKTVTGVETGCMCRVEQTIGADGRIWPSYTPAPDWQQGFATVEVWPDGIFNIDTAKFINGQLLWRDQRYT